MGQHLTGIALLSKVLQEKLSEESMAESADAAKIVRLVNDAIRKTKELARGLLPVVFRRLRPDGSAENNARGSWRTSSR